MEIPHAYWDTIGVTLRLAGVTTLVLLIVGAPLAWWLARSRSIWRHLLEPVVALPLVLPPTVLGFYLLVLLGPAGPGGRLTAALGLPALVFSFPGLVVASAVYSLPFAIQPLQNAFAALGKRPLDAAATLRAGPLDRFFTVALPMARPGLVTSAVLSFAHTIGEFGVVLMIGGSIPGRTKVLSITIYEHVEALEYTDAHWLSAGLVLFSLLVLGALYAVNRRFRGIVA